MRSKIGISHTPRLYPKLMNRISNKGVVILFYNTTSGVLLTDDTDNGHKAGYYSNNWDINLYEDFNGTVSISND